MFDTASLNEIIRNKKSAPAIRILDYRKVGSFVDISAVSINPLDAGEISDNFRIQMKGNAVVVPGSIRSNGKSQHGSLYRFMARPAKVSKPFMETASMTALGNNAFVDNASNIWTVEGEGDEARIFMESNGDTEGLLETFRARVGLNDGMKARAGATYKSDFASYVGSNGVNYGFVHSADTAGVHMISLDNRRIETVSPEAIIVSVDMQKAAKSSGKDFASGDVFDKFDISKKESAKWKELFDFFNKIYPPEFVKEIKKAMGE